ncbi:nose resistant to fluoxetine protein 6-like [Anabrus simplex]|uniref:nose resistant to fluoxetine protein 6-like n=1 Tax=Anabrus simplex TaxID=316456 RepID=UPI0035A34394
MTTTPVYLSDNNSTSEEVVEQSIGNVTLYTVREQSSSVQFMNNDANLRHSFDVKSDLGDLEVLRDEIARNKLMYWDSHINNVGEMFNVFDIDRISRQWYSFKVRVSEQCSATLETYLMALNQSELWAAKMWDATGRYSSGYFWGNGFWMGSQALCYDVEETAPFPLAFSVIKLLLYLPQHLNNKAERIQLGLCLPYNCSMEDVRGLVEATVPEWTQLLKVRTLHNRYDFWDDSIFWTLLDAGEDVTNARNPDACQNKANGVQYDTVTSKKGILSRMILSFSVKLNLETICDPSVGVDTIPIIHGLRFLSMLWVILGHTCIIAFEYSDNRTYREVAEENFLIQTVTKGAYAVDTFFFISGLLVSFLYFRTIAKVDVTKLTRSTGVTSNILQFLGLLIYRYLRLTVPYMFVLGVVQVCMKWFQDTAVFEAPFNDQENCAKYWWRNALYINNFFSANEMCMLWSWYLADDTQFYVLGAMLLILATSHFRFAAVLLGIFLASSWSGTAIVAYQHNHMPGFDDPLALFDNIYDKPWTRLGPYLIGMCVGWLLYKKDCKIEMHKLVVLLGWLLSTVCALFLVYALHKVKLHPLAGAAYSSLSHSMWALVLAWVVVACSTGYGGYVNKFLSLSIIHPFSRVTYCAYLVHPLIIHLVPLRMDSPFHLTMETVTLLFFGQVVASYMLAFIVSVAFEAPVVTLLKIMAPSKDEQKNTKKEEDPDWDNYSPHAHRTQLGNGTAGRGHEIRR